MPERDDQTEAVSHRVFHNRLGDVLVTEAAARAVNGRRIDPIEIAAWLAEAFQNVTVLVWEGERTYFVRYPYNELFTMIFKVAMLPGERAWYRSVKAWIVKKGSIQALERMCKVFGVPLNYMGEWDENATS